MTSDLSTSRCSRALDVIGTRRRCAAHTLPGRVERRTVGKHRQALEDDPLRFVEQLVAPLGDCLRGCAGGPARFASRRASSSKRSLKRSRISPRRRCRVRAAASSSASGNRSSRSQICATSASAPSPSPSTAPDERASNSATAADGASGSTANSTSAAMPSPSRLVATTRTLTAAPEQFLDGRRDRGSAGARSCRARTPQRVSPSTVATIEGRTRVAVADRVHAHRALQRAPTHRPRSRGRCKVDPPHAVDDVDRSTPTRQFERRDASSRPRPDRSRSPSGAASTQPQ